MIRTGKKLTTLALAGVFALGAGVYLSRGPLTQAQAQGGSLKVGDKVAAFTLPSSKGGNATVGDWAKSKATVVLFVATKCPISNAYNGRMAKIASTYAAKGIAFYGVNSNKAELMPEVIDHAKANGFSFPVLKDEGNKIADKWNAQVTPEVYVIDPAGTLVYKGQIDNRKEEESVTERPLAAALDSILAGKAIATTETRAFGCSIKRVN